MFKKLKQMYYRWLNRGVVPQSQVYIVAYQPDEAGKAIVIDSIHTTFESAKKMFNKKEDLVKDSYKIMQYGLWTKV